MPSSLTDTGSTSTSGYLRIEWPLVQGIIELENVMSADQVVSTGSMFWQRVMQEVHNKIMDTLMKKQTDILVKERDARPIVFVKKNAMPRMTWKEDSLILHGIPKKDLMNQNNIAMVEFYINLDIALKFGLVRLKTGKTGVNSRDYVLGPNLQYTLPTDTYDETTEPTGGDQRKFYNWEGENYEGVNYTSIPFAVTTLENVRWMKLQVGFEWQLNNLNASFEKIIGTRKRTVMVYSDLVESTVVGSGKFPLLREVQLLRTGDGESTAEPLHHQWIKLRGQQLDILEVEIASTSGPLAILPPGKTLVTIGLKQL